MNVLFVSNSENKKTGNIAQTYSPSSTCPTTCPLRNNECYAGFGNTIIHWKRLDAGKVGIPWDEFLGKVRKIEAGRVWRHNVAGDICKEGSSEIGFGRLKELVAANRGRRGFTFTHAPLTEINIVALRYANALGFTVNLSADSVMEADAALAHRAGPVVTIIPSDPSLWPSRTPGGHRVVVCPNVTHSKTCLECKLCAIPDRRVVIGFPSHGTRKKSLDRRLMGLV